MEVTPGQCGELQHTELQSGLIKDHQNLNQHVGNDSMKEDSLREEKVRRHKASLEKKPSKGTAEAVHMPPAG